MPYVIDDKDFAELTEIVLSGYENDYAGGLSVAGDILFRVQKQHRTQWIPAPKFQDGDVVDIIDKNSRFADSVWQIDRSWWGNGSYHCWAHEYPESSGGVLKIAEDRFELHTEKTGNCGHAGCMCGKETDSHSNHCTCDTCQQQRKENKK